MKMGTRSVLFGAHQFAIHPWFVARAWWKLYVFPSDPRLWVAFFVHDIGYLGKPNMDGPEGEEHPWTGARIMHKLFDGTRIGRLLDRRFETCPDSRGWLWFTLCHSRYLAKKYNTHYSKLCVADKLAIALTPWWIYLPMVTLTGEIDEYMGNGKRSQTKEHVSKAERHGLTSDDKRLWFKGLQQYMLRWVETHKDGREDQWTKRTEAA